VGLVLGAFGELSTSCYCLCTSIARVAAARLLSFWKMSPEQALASSKQKNLRFWGLTGHRGWARLILDRLNDLVLAPNNSKGSTLDPDKVAHEHRSFFFPDSGHGAANAAGFGWRNSGYRPCVFFCIMFFFLIPPEKNTPYCFFSISM
jgi:hypothetical protein